MKQDVIIIGGGIVGLATAYQLIKKNQSLKVLVLEKENQLAQHQTGHNSGVIHSGIYYKPGSLKAKNCIDGYKMLLDFCNDQDVKYDLCGKVIVATKEEELPQLDMIYSRGIDNGLDKIELIDEKKIHEIEPHVKGVKGIFVPYTGIIDYGEVAEKYAQKFADFGGKVSCGEKVTSIKSINSKEVEVKTQKNSYSCSLLINCAGLFSDEIAKIAGRQHNIKIIPFRGEYYMLKGGAKHLVKNLIYPVPDPNFPFLGVHFTRMIDGNVEAGPNAVFAFKKEGYKKTDFSAADFFGALAWPGFRKVALKYWRTGLGEYKRSFSKKAFTQALQELIPEIKIDDLIAAEAGVRAQACDKEGGLIDDFLFAEENNQIHVLNAPSPAATSSLSIGNTVSDMALTKLKAL
ncbi:MAG: L-2-hydroxyglutarate oxidase [Flavobacteriales bacterium]